jgi:hypothetical protein
MAIFCRFPNIFSVAPPSLAAIVSRFLVNCEDRMPSPQGKMPALPRHLLNHAMFRPVQFHSLAVVYNK